jgi:ketosteroid isomerase-like protein
MHSNADLLKRLYSSLDRHDHQAMAKCYHPDARFRDIAFDLRGRKQIHAMWHMISRTDIAATFDVVHADGSAGRVNLRDNYTFSDTGRRVHNVIDSHFRFRDGLIVDHQDFCDARVWAAMALGGASGFLAGRLRILRASKAKAMLRAFIAEHPEYQ